MTTTATTVAPVRRPAIAGATGDLLLGGGLSIIAFLPLLYFSEEQIQQTLPREVWLLQVLINLPHFVASAWLLYGDREAVREHRFVSRYIPIILVAGIAGATAITPWVPEVSPALMIAAGLALAWHYTGQTWGMVASFGALDGVRIDDVERRLIRGSLRVFMVWHWSWLCRQNIGMFGELAPTIDAIHEVVTIAMAVAVVVGALGYLRLARRLGRLPPPRMLVPWAAIIVWYTLMARDPRAIFWVQIAHALQYLSFPLRVEANRRAPGDRRRGRRVIAAYYAALVVVGYLALDVLVSQTAGLMRDGSEARSMMSQSFTMACVAAVNFHHYIVDSVAWKLRNPRVRRDLFAHVRK